ncbi:MAG: hypothetical protein K2M92_01120, partial [Bacteroidales bacterium]|nr:hypothetical protein [Bacteroidales bacterium]
YMGVKAEEILRKRREKEEKEREKEIRKELKKWSEEQKDRDAAAYATEPLRVSGRALVRNLPEGALFRMEGKDYRLLSHAGGFATATSLSDASALRVHGLLGVEVLEAAPPQE